MTIRRVHECLWCSCSVLCVLFLLVIGIGPHQWPDVPNTSLCLTARLALERTVLGISPDCSSPSLGTLILLVVLLRIFRKALSKQQDKTRKPMSRRNAASNPPRRGVVPPPASLSKAPPVASAADRVPTPAASVALGLTAAFTTWMPAGVLLTYAAVAIKPPAQKSKIKRRHQKPAVAR